MLEESYHMTQQFRYQVCNNEEKLNLHQNNILYINRQCITTHNSQKEQPPKCLLPATKQSKGIKYFQRL